MINVSEWLGKSTEVNENKGYEFKVSFQCNYKKKFQKYPTMHALDNLVSFFPKNMQTRRAKPMFCFPIFKMRNG